MFKFIIDIFCKDTVVGLTDIDEKKYNRHNIKREMRLYKNIYSPLFKKEIENTKKFKDKFTDPIAYRLLEDVQNQKVLYSV